MRDFLYALRSLRATPGVSSATLQSDSLLAGIRSNTSVTLADGTKRDLSFNRIGPDYFATMGTPLTAGRAIDARDRTETPRVIVINDAAAAALFGKEPALGRRVTIFGAETEVVGVVRHTKYDSVRKAAEPTMFRRTTEIAQRHQREPTVTRLPSRKRMAVGCLSQCRPQISMRDCKTG